jgi:hypothetical protein
LCCFVIASARFMQARSAAAIPSRTFGGTVDADAEGAEPPGVEGGVAEPADEHPADVSKIAPAATIATAVTPAPGRTLLGVITGPTYPGRADIRWTEPGGDRRHDGA